MYLRPFSLLILATLLACQSVSPAQAENWPHWRGPEWNGSTTETNLPDRWTKSENVAWVTPLPGRSGATPVIWDDSVFLPSPDVDGNLWLLCIDAKSGKIRWQQKVTGGNAVGGKNNMASPSAVTDGKRVVAMFGTGVLAAYDFAKQLWSRNLATQYGKLALMWLYGSSPTLYQNKLYVEVLQGSEPAAYRHAVDDKPRRQSFLLCLDPQTGDELWRHVRKSDAVGESQEAYSTPIVNRTARGAEILIFGADCVTSNDPESGTELWRSGSLNPKKISVWRTIVSPVASPEGVLVCLPRTFNPVLAVSPRERAAGATAPVKWRSSEASADVPTPLYYQGKYFVLNGNKQTLLCLDPKTGATKWSGRLPAGEVFSASPTGADGKIYCIGEAGTAVVVSAGDEFKVISHCSMDDESAKVEAGKSSQGGPVLSSIAVANGHLFIRTARNLYCIGAKP